MRIALDYDNTYTADPLFWNGFIKDAWARGHEVRIVTVRDERHDRTAPLIELERRVQIIYTRGVAKQHFCTHVADDGWVPEVWIDDSPRSILENSSASPEWLTDWRATRNEAGADIDPLGR
jgi:hypothetical protein